MTPAPDDTIYAGCRLTDDAGRIVGPTVMADGHLLDPRPSWSLRKHSPTGFEWGYSGSGPAQLALALVYHATGDSALSLNVYQWFKSAVVSTWSDTWRITAAEVRGWVAQWEAEHDRLRPDVTAGEGGAP